MHEPTPEELASLPREILYMGRGQAAISIDEELASRAHRRLEHLEEVHAKTVELLAGMRSSGATIEDLIVAWMMLFPSQWEPETAHELLAYVLAKEVCGDRS